MGLAGIGVVVVVIAAVAALAGVIPGSPLAPATNGTLFNGDGYSIVIPDTYPFVYGRVSNGDKWAADVPGLPRGITVIVAANLLPGEESLEGALGRATNSLAYAGFSVRGNPQTVSLPAGGAYRVETNNGVTAYAFYERGRVFAVMLINLTREEEEAVARSLAFR